MQGTARGAGELRTSPSAGRCWLGKPSDWLRYEIGELGNRTGDGAGRAAEGLSTLQQRRWHAALELRWSRDWTGDLRPSRCLGKQLGGLRQLSGDSHRADAHVIRQSNLLVN